MSFSVSNACGHGVQNSKIHEGIVNPLDKVDLLELELKLLTFQSFAMSKDCRRCQVKKIRNFH